MSSEAFVEAQDRLLHQYGVPAESTYIDVPTVEGRAHVLVTGDGPPVVMVIGGGAPAAMWAPLIPHLDRFTIYAVDRPGFGLTDTAPHTTENLRALAVGFLGEVLDGLGLDRPVFVSNSMGSLWTTWLALDTPDRVAAMTQIGCGAVILDTSAPPPMRLIAVRGLGRLMMSLQKPSPSQAEQVLAMMNEESPGPELTNLMVECAKLPTYSSTWLELLNSVLRLRGARPEVSLGEDELAHLRQPVQMIWGEDDPFGRPEVGERAAGIIDDAEFHRIPGGHTPWLAHPERIGGLMSPFLRKHSVGT